MLARAIAGFALVPVMGFTGVTLGNPIAWIFADAFLIPAYFHVKKVMRDRLEKQRQNEKMQRQQESVRPALKTV